MQYGASTPAALVQRAAAHGQPMLALTDRNGLYGAVRFVRACSSSGIAPVLGVDLAVEAMPDHPPAPEPSLRRAPLRGGSYLADDGPRVTVLARGQAAGLAPGLGWAALCRLVTATHLRGERGRPVTSPQLLAQAAGVTICADAAGRPGAPVWPSRLIPRHSHPSPILVLLGPDSDIGRAIQAGRGAEAQLLLERWQQLLPADGLAIEVVCHDAAPGERYSAAHAERMWLFAQHHGLACVLSAAVRHAEPEQAAIVDVLDAARRLVMLDQRHLDRVSTAGHLAPARVMFGLARRITGDDTRARLLMRHTLELAAECVQDPHSDIGLGSIHLPEPSVLGLRPGEDPQVHLAQRCWESIPWRYPGASEADLTKVRSRLEDELAVIAKLGYATYFLTVASVCDLIRAEGVRVAARGSGAGSLINHLLGISGIDPIEHGLLMERFCTPLRAQLPDIDIDVESDRRTQMYERILERFGGERVTCVSMMETYRVRHAVRDVGSALGLPATEIDAIAKAFPHVRAKDARNAIADLPELRAQGLDATRLEVLFELVERLDGLPRHIALHPCGMVLSGAGLLDRTPVEASWLGFPMSQFDKDDVEALGFLKLDVLGIRMQSAMAHCIDEIARTESVTVDLDDRACVPLDDEATFDLIRSTHTLGCFQIESPGQRELVGKFAPSTFGDLIIDISLFRPGPVKSDMITPFLRARQGWSEPEYLHPTLMGPLEETCGVVVFHEQVLHIVAITTGISLAEADEVRRALGTHDGQAQVEVWWRAQAAARGYAPGERDRIWEVLAAFASFGFCKAHAAAFALPTYQSAWLKTHHPAAFYAGVLTHDPGMYPKRLILDDARCRGVPVLGLDINSSRQKYRVESDGSALGIRIPLAEVDGMSEVEVAQVVAGQPYSSLEDFWQRAQVSRPVVEKLVLAGGFDTVYGIDAGANTGLGRRGGVTRRDLLLHVGDLERWSHGTGRGKARNRRSKGPVAAGDVRAQAACQAQGRTTPVAASPVQLALDLGEAPALASGSGLPELDAAERVRAELDVLGLDVSGHVLDPYRPMLHALEVIRSVDLRTCRSRSEVLVAGAKVATQTPPVRSGRRVVFLTLDDGSGPLDATFFEDVQGPYATTIFHGWLLLVRGVVRRTGPNGLSLRATGAWDLSELADSWAHGGLDAAAEVIAASPSSDSAGAPAARQERRVLVHPSGFTQSPYSDIAPAGDPARRGGPRGGSPDLPPPLRKLWHASPGSSGR